MAKQLAQRDVANFNSSKHDREASISDRKVAGLIVRKRLGKAAFYELRFRDGGGRSRRKTLGTHPGMKLGEARDAAVAALGAVQDGTLQTQKGQRAALTVSELLNEVAEHLRSQGRSDHYIRMSSDYAVQKIAPVLGRKKVQDVTAGDVAKFLRSLSGTPATHNRV